MIIGLHEIDSYDNVCINIPPACFSSSCLLMIMTRLFLIRSVVRHIAVAAYLVLVLVREEHVASATFFGAGEEATAAAHDATPEFVAELAGLEGQHVFFFISTQDHDSTFPG